jgi:hypothetical protein
MPDAFYAGGGIGLGPAAPQPEVERYPAPLISSRDGVPGPVKRAVRDMERTMSMAGWSVMVTYAKGWIPHGSLGTPGTEPRESLAVRMARENGRQRAVAVYVDHGASWAWDTLCVWRMDGRPRMCATVSAFYETMIGKPQGTAPWHAPWIYPGLIA